MAIASLSYVRLEMREPADWLWFGEQVLGFASRPAEDGTVPGALCLAMDAMPFRYLIEPGDADRFAAAGWECADAGAYERLVEAVRDAGALTRLGSDAEARSRGAAGLAFGVDPSGNAFELCHGRTVNEASFSSPIDGLRFVTGAMGLGHAVLPAPEFEATDAFYREVLGFGVSDELTLPPPAEGAPPQRIHFLHADNPRHHSVGLYNFPAPSGVVHLMAEVETLDDVGACLDRAKAAEAPIVASLGRHLNDGMVSFYMLAPGGIPIEYGYDGRQFDWSAFEPTRSTAGDIWGHEYNFPG